MSRASTYAKCRTCGEYDFLDAHGCGIPYTVRRADDDADEARTVYARDADIAAVRFCERYDSDFEYAIVREGDSGGDPEVIVRDALGKERRFWIMAETRPHYSARERT